MSLKNEPASEPLHIPTASGVFGLSRATTVWGVRVDLARMGVGSLADMISARKVISLITLSQLKQLITTSLIKSPYAGWWTARCSRPWPGHHARGGAPGKKKTVKLRGKKKTVKLWGAGSLTSGGAGLSIAPHSSRFPLLLLFFITLKPRVE